MQTVIKIIVIVIFSVMYPFIIYLTDRLNIYLGAIDDVFPDIESYIIDSCSYYIGLFVGAFWLIISIYLSHWLFKTWWLGVIGGIAGLLLVYSMSVYLETRADNTLFPYTLYKDNVITETGNTMRSTTGPKQGEITTYSNGRIKSIETYEQGEKHGKATIYYENGRVKNIEIYVQGKISGTCKIFHKNGMLLATGSQNGSKWNEQKQREEGVMTGQWKFYREDGTLDDEREYDNDRVTSSKNYSLRFDSTGLVRGLNSGELFTGRLNKQGIIMDEYLFPNLYTTNVVAGKLDGSLISYYNIKKEISIAATAVYAHGARNGEVRAYYPNGQLKSTGLYVNGKPEGYHQYYYEDSVANRESGQLEYEATYKRGKRNGVVKWYYENGNLETEREYSDGERNGVYRNYTMDGKLDVMYIYREGKKDGIYEKHYTDGTYVTGSYRNDKLMLEREFRKNGVIKTVRKYGIPKGCIRKENYDENGNLI